MIVVYSVETSWFEPAAGPHSKAAWLADRNGLRQLIWKPPAGTSAALMYG